MEPSELPRTRLLFALVVGAAAGALSMALVMVIPQEVAMRRLGMQGPFDAALWTLWFLMFTVPIALVVGFPAYSFLRNRRWLSYGSVCITGALAGLATQVAMYGMSGQAVPLGFLMLGGFGGLIAAAVCSLLIFRRSRSTVERI
jgi:hypothetical protein